MTFNVTDANSKCITLEYKSPSKNHTISSKPQIKPWFLQIKHATDKNMVLTQPALKQEKRALLTISNRRFLPIHSTEVENRSLSPSKASVSKESI